MNNILESHKIRVNIPDKLPLIYIDFHLMQQVLSNLIRNAVLVTPKDKEIGIEIHTADTLFDIAVTDSGPGIPEDALKNIFERFYRVPGTPAGGLGLGLWLAKNIVELHGGKISVRNRLEGGAVFTITLPLNAQPENPPEAVYDN
jgi:two-component system sensor histidine kinase KdpD